MTQVLDFTVDPGHRELYRWSQLYAFPDYVKKADPTELERNTSFPATVYADPGRRQFPAGTRASCWLSWCSFLDKAAQIEEPRRSQIKGRLEKNAMALAINGDIQDLKTKHASHQNTSLEDLPDDTFAIVKTYGDGSKDRKYPLRNPDEIKYAAAWLVRHRHHFDLRDVRKIATRIIEKGDEMAVAMPEKTAAQLQRYVGAGFSPARKIGAEINLRVAAGIHLGGGETADRKPLYDGMRKLARLFIQGDSPVNVNPHLRAQVADILDEFDKEHHFKVACSKGDMRWPEDIVYQDTSDNMMKVAQNMCELQNGQVFMQDDFDKLAVHEVRDVFGNDIANEVGTGLDIDPVKMAEVAATLPRPDAIKLARILASKGVQPVLTSKAAASRGLGLGYQQLRELAAD